MHILIGILTLLGALTTWYFRLRRLGSAAKGATRLAQRVRNAPRKFAFMRRAENTGLKAVEDPREAASVLMVLVAGGYGEGPLADGYKVAIRSEVKTEFKLDDEEAEALLVHAIWMLRDVEEPSGVAGRMARVIVGTPAIGAKELIALDTMLIQISEASGTPGEEALFLLQIYRDQAGLRT